MNKRADNLYCKLLAFLYNKFMKKNSNLKQEVKDLNEKLRNNKIYLEDDEEEEI